MARLIDADIFRQSLRNIQTDAENYDDTVRRDTIGRIIDMLDAMPTVNDKKED